MYFAYSRRPWTLKGAHLNLQEWRPDLTWEEVDFSWSTFWIQVHELPPCWQNKENLERIGGKAGRVKEVDSVGENIYQGRLFIRIRVDVNITKPLLPSFFLPRPRLNDLWINLKYEKLPDTCFNCGLLDHDGRSCDINPLKLSNQFGVKFLAYGQWMRTENFLIPLGVYDRQSHVMEEGLEEASQQSEVAAVVVQASQDQKENQGETQARGELLGVDDKKAKGQTTTVYSSGLSSPVSSSTPEHQRECRTLMHDGIVQTTPTPLKDSPISVQKMESDNKPKVSVSFSHPNPSTPILFSNSSCTSDPFCQAKPTKDEPQILMPQSPKPKPNQTTTHTSNQTSTRDSLNCISPSDSIPGESNATSCGPSQPSHKPKWKKLARANPHPSSPTPNPILEATS